MNSMKLDCEFADVIIRSTIAKQTPSYLLPALKALVKVCIKFCCIYCFESSSRRICSRSGLLEDCICQNLHAWDTNLIEAHLIESLSR